MKVPYGYGNAETTLEDTRARLLVHHHPEYVARLVAWFQAQDGRVGIGGGWRADGSQPDKPGFAPAGKSFHQNQKYSDGFIGATAVDLVHRSPGNKHRSPTWAEVPAQGSVDARLWGLHCNVGTPGARGSEPWHVQPIEIDGHSTFIRDGSPAPVANYPFPGRFIVEEGNEMSAIPAKRWFDTRVYGVPLNGGEPFNAVLPDHVAGATSLYLNITIVDPSDDGFIVCYGGPMPDTSNVNFKAGNIEHNAALVDVVGGHVQFRLSDNVNHAHVVVDIQGYNK